MPTGSLNYLLWVRKILLCSVWMNQVSITVVGRKPFHLLLDRLAILALVPVSGGEPRIEVLPAEDIEPEV